MGSYLNPRSDGFQMSFQSEIYVDKSGLIGKTNAALKTMQRFICVSRPHRFGKSMAADMLAAYYGCGEDTGALFEKLKISSEPSYMEHLNKYDVIKVNMQEFLSATHSVEEMLSVLQKQVGDELRRAYPEIVTDAYLPWVMRNIYAATDRSFVIIIDEWDCVIREYADERDAQKRYTDFLCAWFKDQAYVGLAYMTGILPIKKFGTHSGLNIFWEYSMTDPGDLAEYFGFTEDEVKSLCNQYGMSFEEANTWYDGYALVSHSRRGVAAYSMYCPKSVVEAMLRRKFVTYWNHTEPYGALGVYIQMKMDGLKETVIRMLAGESVEVNTGTFMNDMATFNRCDDVLTLLVHLGYLTYNWSDKTVSIPNKEVSQEYINAISTMDWHEVIRAVDDSRKLVQSLWDMDADAVAAGIERAHQEISILQYNDENSLSCTITLAFYFARKYYTIIRELPAGKGFADICLIPRRLYADKPAVVIELKWDKTAHGAIDQIKEKQYVAALAEYKGNLILAGIDYDRKEKKHSCGIEKVVL